MVLPEAERATVASKAETFAILPTSSRCVTGLERWMTLKKGEGPGGGTDPRRRTAEATLSGALKGFWKGWDPDFVGVR